MGYSIFPYDKKFRKEAFDCGVPALDSYLKERAGQDVRNHYASLFLAAEDGTQRVLGYYTLSSASVCLRDVPESLKKTLPKYPDIPAIRLGRLAVDRTMQGKGLGAELLADAVFRAVANVAAWSVMVVDAKDEAAVRFYEKFGFSRLPDDRRRLYVMRKPLEDFIRGLL